MNKQTGDVFVFPIAKKAGVTSSPGMNY